MTPQEELQRVTEERDALRNELESEAPAEAGFSMNFQMVHETIGPAQITLRGARAADWQAVMVQAKHFAAYAKQNGWAFKAAPQSVPMAAQHSEVPPPAQSQPSALQPKPAAQPSGNVLTFSAETLEGSVTGGKSYWKVKGGRYRKHGVTIWPETLDAAGFSSLTPGSTYDLNGYTAHYIEKEEGRPDKVIKLEN